MSEKFRYPQMKEARKGLTEAAISNPTEFSKYILRQLDLAYLRGVADGIKDSNESLKEKLKEKCGE